MTINSSPSVSDIQKFNFIIMKKTNVLVIIVSGVILVITLLSAKVFSSNEKKMDTNGTEKLSYTKKQLYKYTMEKNIEQAELKALSAYKTCPPLRPERFRRKIKMLWGIDINDYPADAQIWFNDDIVISKKFQTVESHREYSDDYPFPVLEHPDSIFQYFRQYLFYSDAISFRELEKYRQLTIAELMKDIYNRDSYEEISALPDFLLTDYRSTPFKINSDIVKHIDKLSSFVYYLFVYSFSEEFIPGRVTDIRCDYLSRYIASEQKKGRSVGNYPEDNKIWLGFNLSHPTLLDFSDYNPTDIIQELSFYNFKPNVKTQRPWHNYTAEKGICCFLSFMLQLQNQYADKTVILFMSGQIDFLDLYAEIIKHIKKNNYYGYTLLREFCENPMREMPALKKMGVSFRAGVKEKNTLLYLEPFSDSYDIDTIQPTEFLKAFEMGHDNYYFIEVEKPVESPVAGTDGYAMLLDRTETIYGYIPKKQIKSLTDADILQWETTRDTTKSKNGLINDPDGYVNIRKEQNAKSEIVGQIKEKEVFRYWEIPTNWYVVETEAGLRGFVYKDRIRSMKKVK